MSNTIIPYIFDVELSGKCNTACSFCPREEMLRGEKYMEEATFNSFFSRFSRYVKMLENQEVYLPHEQGRAQLGTGTLSPVRVLFCGMGESLMNPHCPNWVGKIRKEIGVRVSVVTNGLLLKKSIIEKLVDADITVVLVSVPGVNKETYDRYMKIEWERVLENILRAHESLPGRVQINATIPDDADFGPQDVEKLWGTYGIPIAGINHCHNRGGFLTDQSLTGRFGDPQFRFCGIIARHNFIAWDGRILSCCHDLHAANVFGDVFGEDFMELAKRKTPVITEGPKFSICKSCNDLERCHAGQILVLSPASIQSSAVE